MKAKNLIKEGITEELLNSLSAKKLGNPVQIQPNDEPVNLIKCTKGFWISVDCEIMKDAKNELIVISEKQAIIARARYLVNYELEVANENEEAKARKLQLKIDAEVERLKELTEVKAKEYLSETKFILQLAGIIESDLSFTLRTIIFNENGTLQQVIEKAKEITSQGNYLSSYNKLKKWYEEDNYDNLYAYLFQDGIFQIASFSCANLFNSTDMDVMKKYFHRDVILDTVDEIKCKTHMENIAKFNIEKQLAKSTI